MSDFDLDAVRARQAAARAQRAAAVDLDAHRGGYDPVAIAACELCDDDGYRGTAVCDHQDHTAAAARGMAKVRAALAQTKIPTQEQP